MTIDELRDGLTILAQNDPDFLANLIGEVLKSRLSIDKQDDGRYYDPRETIMLKWKDGEYNYYEISRTY